MEPARPPAAPGPDDDPGAGPPLPAWAESLVRWLDDGVRVPGTEVRFGLDPILGTVLPGGGDAVTGAASVALLLLALQRGVRTAILFRMVLNVGVDVVLGSVPVAGDVFDFFHRSNRKNLELLRAHTVEGARPSVVDYALLGLGVLLALAGVAIPLILLFLVGSRLGDLFRSGL